MRRRRTTLGAVEARLERAGVLVPGARLSGSDAAREIWDVVADSREVRLGVLFCAWRGTARDSHEFAAEAVAAGAAGVLVEAPIDGLGAPQLHVTDGRAAAARAAAAFFGDPADELRLVAVTGTNGKTTTAAMLGHLLSGDRPTGYLGTLGMVLPDGTTVSGTEGLTTPGPVELARWLRDFVDRGAGGVVLEASSHALDQGRLAALRFDAAVFTNLTRDHLDYHGSLEAYRDAKLRLLDLLAGDGVAVFNADDPAWDDHPPVGRRVRFGTGDDAEIRAEAVRPAPGGMEFRLRTPDGAAPVALPLVGDFNVSNALAGAAVLWALGWPTERIAAALGDLPQVRGRLERVELGAGSPAVLLDYAHTPDALERALRAVRPLVEGRLIVVFGAGGDRDQGKRAEMGRVAAEHADLAILTSDNPRTEDPEAILDEVERGMGRAPRQRLSDRRAAIRAALTDARPEDMVLLAGKGHETYQIVGTEKRSFDERQIVREIVDDRTAGGAA